MVDVAPEATATPRVRERLLYIIAFHDLLAIMLRWRRFRADTRWCSHHRRSGGRRFRALIHGSGESEGWESGTRCCPYKTNPTGPGVALARNCLPNKWMRPRGAAVGARSSLPGKPTAGSVAPLGEARPRGSEPPPAAEIDSGWASPILPRFHAAKTLRPAEHKSFAVRLIEITPRRRTDTRRDQIQRKT